MHCSRKLQSGGGGGHLLNSVAWITLKELSSLAVWATSIPKVRGPKQTMWVDNYRHEKVFKALSGCHCVEVCLQMRTAKGQMRCVQCEITLVFAVFNQQGDNKKMEDAKCYLTLPCTKTEMEEKEAPSGKNLHHLANFTPTKDSTKDSFQIATLICSTKLTQNGRFCISSLAVSCCIFEVKRALSLCKFFGVAACVGIVL